MRRYVVIAVLLASCTSKAPWKSQQRSSESAFEMLDLNHDGFISYDEWTVAESKAESRVDPSLLAQFHATLEDSFRHFDRNHDGRIDKDEYEKPDNSDFIRAGTSYHPTN